MRDRSGWTRGPDGEHTIGRKKYKNLVEYSRPCVTCHKRFSIFVTPKIASGEADSNSFGLKNCDDHRRSAVRVDDPEAEKLRIANATMSEELTGLYALVREQRNTIDKLRTTYELGPAMKAQAEGVTHPTVPLPPAKAAAIYGVPTSNKMPWE